MLFIYIAGLMFLPDYDDRDYSDSSTTGTIAISGI